jgi:putative methyltransferase
LLGFENGRVPPAPEIKAGEPLFGDKKPAANKAGTNRFFLVFFKDE